MIAAHEVSTQGWKKCEISGDDGKTKKCEVSDLVNQLNETQSKLDVKM